MECTVSKRCQRAGLRIIMRCEAPTVHDESVAIELTELFLRTNSITGFDVNIILSAFLREVLAVPFFVFAGVAMSHLEKPDNELELLRTALSLDNTLYTVHRHSSRPKGHVRVDCFASKEAGSSGLTRITSLVAGVLKYHRNVSRLTMSNSDDVDINLVVALSKKLELDLKHERLNSTNHCCPMLFFNCK